MRKNLLIMMSSLHAGGAERQTVDLINNLDADRFTVSLRYFDRREALLPGLKQSQLQSVACLDRRGRLDLSMLREMNGLVDRERIDTVVCISPYPLLYGYLARRLYRKRYKLVTVIHHTIQRPGSWERVKASLFKRFLNRCDLIVFVCKNQLDYWVEEHGVDAGKCTYVYNGIDTTHFAEAAPGEGRARIERQYGIAGADIVLGSVARFRAEKKQEEFVQAAKELRESGYPIKVLLVGDGPRRRFVERHINTAGLQEHVFMTGSQRDVRPYLHAMDCFVNSSHQETFSIAALEAMAAGKPLIMTDVGGTSELLEHGVNGFLYAPGDVGGLAENIKTLIDRDQIKAMGQRSRLIVTERFTLRKMVDDYENILFDL